MNGFQGTISMGLKPEGRNPRSEKNPNPENRKLALCHRPLEPFFSPAIEAHFGLRISVFFRDSGIRHSAFWLNPRLLPG
jgi:hypothetical protein